jgi:ribosomal protein S18 acetylase RimI-like enzyme
VEVRPRSSDDQSWIERLLADRWGATAVVSRGRVHDASSLRALVALEDGERVGLLTYHVVVGGELEVVTLDALRESSGVGTALLDAVKREAEAAGCTRVWLITTNDNLRALGFYQRRGFRLVAVHVGAIERSRELKPNIPAVGAGGIPVCDEIELAYELSAPQASS